ncbi:hypothetical protein NHX12_027420 [Muraenolepis orangiensis]|uniref:Uncharacterized protein n=1 Tax=Muraenolepis orangiensis TaxID=630683 RepID=A0A9Q0EGW5_9TELE|nr:hypothetical protein NHX12_027420 [Muraenolepis orangiensis]
MVVIGIVALERHWILQPMGVQEAGGRTKLLSPLLSGGTLPDPSSPGPLWLGWQLVCLLLVLFLSVVPVEDGPSDVWCLHGDPWRMVPQTSGVSMETGGGWTLRRLVSPWRPVDDGLSDVWCLHGDRWRMVSQTSGVSMETRGGWSLRRLVSPWRPVEDGLSDVWCLHGDPWRMVSESGVSMETRGGWSQSL